MLILPKWNVHEFGDILLPYFGRHSSMQMISVGFSSILGNRSETTNPQHLTANGWRHKFYRFL